MELAILLLVFSIAQCRALIVVNQHCTISSTGPSYEEFRDEFRLLEDINSGSLAIVRKYQSCSQNNCIYAVKEFKEDEENFRAIANELSIYGKISGNPFFPVCYGTLSFTHAGKRQFLLFLEFISKYDLFEFMTEVYFGGFQII